MNTLKYAATQQSTSSLPSKFHTMNYNSFSDTGIMISDIGFGSYRVNLKDPGFKESLLLALEMGVNLIDTSSNYYEGEAEKLIGEVLLEAVDSGLVSREQLMVVTKAGYIQGKLLSDVKEGNKSFPEILAFSEELYHCIHSEFLQDQIQASLSHMNLERVDVFLLHNPEYFLTANASKPDFDALKETFYNRIKEAFIFLETQVEAGLISYYGISSNSFQLSKEDPTFLDLDRLLSIAKDINSNHNFKCIQCPCNLLETQAITLKQYESNAYSLLEWARKHNLCTLSNRPLNAIHNNKLLRLTEYEIDYSIQDDSVSMYVDAIELMEQELNEHINNEFNDIELQLKEKIGQCFSIANSLKESWSSFQSSIHWRDIFNMFLVPNVELGFHLLAEFKEDSFFESWSEQYLQRFKELVDQVSYYYQNLDNDKSQHIKETIISAVPKLETTQQLNSLAIQLLRSSKQITSVLIGMRQVQYVEHVLSTLSSSDIDITDSDWSEIQKRVSLLTI